jgi:ABC-type transport system substrate-binding protein
VSPDGLRYDLELREGAFFHDGTPVTARDVKRSMERLLHPKTPSPGASMYAALLGFDAFRAGKAKDLAGVTVEGERLVRFTLAEPDAAFLSKLTIGFAAPVCASAGAFTDTHAEGLPCGAGPFRFVAWEADKGVRLARHEGYYAADTAHLDGVVWTLGMPGTTQRYKFERGELDYTHELQGVDRDRYLASAAWSGQHRWVEMPATWGVFLNTEVPPFDRRAVRRAVAHALDPLAVSAMRADLAATTRIVPATIPGPAERPPMRRHDVALALREMAEAGYPYDPATGKGGYPQPIDYLAVADTGDQQQAEVWQQQLAQIGLRIRLRLVTWATFLAEVQRRKQTPMGNTGWSADFPDPSNFFEPILSTEAIQDEASQNVAFFSNAELDALLARAHKEPDERVRLAAYERAEAMVRDEAPWIPTLTPRTFEIWHPWVRGYRPHAVVRGLFNEVWIDRGEARPTALVAPLGGRR